MPETSVHGRAPSGGAGRGAQGIFGGAPRQQNTRHMQSMLTEMSRLTSEAGLVLEYAATGGATNTALAVQALLQQDLGPMSSEAIRRQTPIVSILGGVGRDQLGYKLQDYLKETGIQPLFSEIVSESTGWTAFLCASRRERAADRPALSSQPSEEKVDGSAKLAVVYRAIQAGAANQYKLDHLRFKIWEQVEAAGVVYAEATFLTVSFESVKILAEHCAKMGNTFCLNLSAPYVCRYFGDRILTVMPYTDFVFGSETASRQRFAHVPRMGSLEGTGEGGGTYAPGSQQPAPEHQVSKFRVLRFDGSLMFFWRSILVWSSWPLSMVSWMPVCCNVGSGLRSFNDFIKGRHALSVHLA
ncbi:ADK2 [Symbiodinium sp. CCMP2592]|nr:ADK2 [Symbiodinium sp. CCMP2592]